MTIDKALAKPYQSYETNSQGKEETKQAEAEKKACQVLPAFVLRLYHRPPDEVACRFEVLGLHPSCEPRCNVGGMNTLCDVVEIVASLLLAEALVGDDEGSEERQVL